MNCRCMDGTNSSNASEGPQNGSAQPCWEVLRGTGVLAQALAGSDANESIDLSFLELPAVSKATASPQRSRAANRTVHKQSYGSCEGGPGIYVAGTWGSRWDFANFSRDSSSQDCRWKAILPRVMPWQAKPHSKTTKPEHGASLHEGE